ncbi:hypothetical protein Ahia01_001155200 [Argonauta hians]
MIMKYPRVDTSNLLVLVVYFTALLTAVVSAEQCKQVGPCICVFPHWKLDLNPIVEKASIDLPLFSYHIDEKTYEFKPCVPFVSNRKGCNGSQDLAIDMFTEKECQVLANQKSVKFLGDINMDGDVYLEYKHTTNITITSRVYLMCNEIQEFILSGTKTTSTSAIYIFNLFTRYACPLPRHATLSTGSILLIMFLLVMVTYLLGGFAFKHFYVGAQGVEIIPHYTFWSDFPLLVRDGCSYTFRCCRGPSSYERI